MQPHILDTEKAHVKLRSLPEVRLRQKPFLQTGARELADGDEPRNQHRSKLR